VALGERWLRPERSGGARMGVPSSLPTRTRRTTPAAPPIEQSALTTSASYVVSEKTFSRRGSHIAVLFAHKPLSAMDKAERVRACYLHACLRYVTRRPMTNASLCQRLGIDDKNLATASRLLGEAVEAGLIVIADPDVGTRIRSYLPFWAAAGPNRGPDLVQTGACLMASLRKARPEPATRPQVHAYKGVTATRIACWLLDGHLDPEGWRPVGQQPRTLTGTGTWPATRRSGGR